MSPLFKINPVEGAGSPKSWGPGQLPILLWISASVEDREEIKRPTEITKINQIIDLIVKHKSAFGTRYMTWFFFKLNE